MKPHYTVVITLKYNYDEDISMESHSAEVVLSPNYDNGVELIERLEQTIRSGYNTQS